MEPLALLLDFVLHVDRYLGDFARDHGKTFSLLLRVDADANLNHSAFIRSGMERDATNRQIPHAIDNDSVVPADSVGMCLNIGQTIGSR